MTSPTPVKTSVIIPVYNTEEYLPACLDSVLSQTQREIEVILVDDGSTDGSLTIEQSYAARDPRVRIIQQPNLRQGTARNRGLAEARGEYVYFMDSDDLIVPELFETCYAACKADDLDFVTFDSAGFRDDPNIERPDLFGEIRDRTDLLTTEIVDGPTFWNSSGFVPFICWLEYFDRSFLLENNLQFVERIYFEDNDWIVRVFMAAQRIRYIPKKLHRYRDRPGSNVHSGFSHVLADSTFDVHEILCNLMREHADDPIRLGMIRGVNYVKDRRFLQFVQLKPTEDLICRTRSFAKTAQMVIADADESDTIRGAYLHSLACLAKGTSLWGREPIIPLTKQFFTPLMLNGLPTEIDAPRIGIYGTGKACKEFMRLYQPGSQEFVFLETNPKPNQTAFGKPVHPIADAGLLGLDAIIITSEKYAEAMLSFVHQYCGDSMRTFVVPRAVLAFEGIELGDKVPYNGFARLKRKLINLARPALKRLK